MRGPSQLRSTKLHRQHTAVSSTCQSLLSAPRLVEVLSRLDWVGQFVVREQNSIHGFVTHSVEQVRQLKNGNGGYLHFQTASRTTFCRRTRCEWNKYTLWLARAQPTRTNSSKRFWRSL